MILQKALLALGLLVTCSSASARFHNDLDDIIKARIRDEIRDITGLGDDIPNKLVLPPTFANKSDVKLSFFAYETPERENAEDTYDGVFNVFRAYDLSRQEEAVLRERTYYIRGDFDDTRARVRVAGSEDILESADNGVFDTWIKWDGPDASNSTYEVTSLESRGETGTGTVFIGKGGGDMVIADVDDILKESNTNDLTEFFANTFFRPFVRLPNMLEYLSSLNGTDFHYVTGLPIVLYPSVGKWVVETYPAGSMTMRPATEISLESLRSGVGTGGFRKDAIVDILQTFPEKRGVILGDTYGTSLKSFGGIVKEVGVGRVCLYLRNLGGSNFLQTLAEEAWVPEEQLREHVVIWNQVSDLQGHPKWDAC